MNMSKFVRVTRTVNNKGKLVKPEEVQALIKDDKDYYVSTYFYSDEHLKQFQEKGSVKGIKDVKTDKIWFDFDSKDSTLEDARKDALTLLERLKNTNIDVNKCEIYFSGNKGFNVIVNLKKELNPTQVALVAGKLAANLTTFDTSLYDASQILRIPGTKHQDSGLYKIPLTVNQLKEHSINEIKETAANNQILGTFTYEKFDLADELFEEIVIKKEIPKEKQIDSFDLRNRPKGWKASKWALVQGEMQRGERDTGSLIILATCRSLGYDKITAYYLSKGALNRAWEKYGKGSFSKEDLWAKTERVYSDEWQGGSFTVEDEPILQKVCERLEIRDESSKSLTVGSEELFNRFKDYAKNIDELTIKTGILPLDSRLRMTVGMSIGLIAPPGAGKTSIGLQILHNMSKAGQQCIFFSYDMYDALVAQKIVQKHKNLPQDKVLDLFKNNNEAFIKEAKEVFDTEYPNVEFCFQNGQSVEDIQETIKYVQEKKGKPVRFIVLDYNELIMTSYTDPTQSSAYVAQKIRQVAIEHNLCALSLFQPSKMSGDPSQEITSYRAAKGSSAIEQSLSVILGMSRPGCTPELSDKGYDHFAVVNCLKNRFGGLFRLELAWDALQGTVRKLDSETFQQLNELKELLQRQKAAENDSW